MKAINTMRLCFDSRSANESFARTAVAAFLCGLDPTVEELTDVKTAVSEAVTNCIVHGYREKIDKVYITANIYSDNRIVIKIKDKGCGIEDVKKAMEPLFTTAPEEERAGLGFAVMESLMDKVKVFSQPQKGTTVVLEKRIVSTTAENERSRMIEENMGLVHACAHKFKGKGIEYDDLFQAGCMGLVKATDAFDTQRGVRFSTYAVPVILGEMRRLFRDGGTVKVSRSLKELSMKVVREREKFAKETGREPTVGELSQRLGVEEEAVVEALGASAPVVSLTSDEDSSEIDLPVSSPEELLSDLISLKQMLGQLEERDRKLIQLRYFQNKTQVQTAKELDMTQVQVSRREKKILLWLRGMLI